MKKRKIIKIVYCIYLVALISFIFGNSMASTQESAEQSGKLLAFFNNILDSLHFPFLLSSLFIRKLAHFTEYFILGASLFGYLTLDQRVDLTKIIYCTFGSCLIAMTDETIQYFSGRGSMLLDVWLDAVSASLAVFLFYVIYKHKQKKHV